MASYGKWFVAALISAAGAACFAAEPAASEKGAAKQQAAEQKAAEPKLAVGVETVSQGLPLHERHDKVQGAVSFARVVEGEHVRMVQPSGELCFADEAVARQRLRNLSAQDLDGDVPVMPKIARQIDRGHPAAAKLAFNVVLARQQSLELAVRRGKAQAWGEGI